MSWDELETRVRQEVSKRLDVTLCAIGVQPGRNGLRLDNPTPGQFFFSGDELPGRVSLLRERLPREAEEIVAEANEICRHRFRLLGYRDLDYGAEIDWHLDAAHGLRSPLIPWFKINFLDFAQVGDHKVTWELSRHQHLVTLAKAWLLTSEDVYTREIVAQWYSWQRANPYPLGANWASSLEVAFRSLSWIWLNQLLAECRALPSSFQQDLSRALTLNGRHIERYLSTYFSPNTHLLGEAVALFFIGTMFPQISSAESWKKKGWTIIQEELLRQVRPDGVYFEQSLYYHVYALDFFLRARLLASQNGVEIHPGFDFVLRKMLAVIQALAESGPPDGFGDDDGGRVFNPRRNRAEHMTDPLVIGAALFHDETLTAATLTEESIWLFGEAALPMAAKPNSLRKPKSQSFPDGGLYLAASSEPFAQQMVIDAGPQGTGRSGHGHADALSLKLAFGGRSWLVDAGTFCYIGPGDERNKFRGTCAHNTLSVDGLDQAEPAGPFAWTSIPHTQTDLWIAGTNFTLFAGSHSGYERLPEPVRHRRFVFHLHGSFWLVRDVAEGSGSHLLETSWHFAPDLAVSSRGRGFVALEQGQLENPRRLNQLTLLPLVDPRWQSELLPEYISPAYGARESASVVRCSTRIALPAEYSVLLVPTVEGTEEPGEFLRHENQQNPSPATPEVVYRYHRGADTHTMIFRQAQTAAWNFGPWTSDAKFLYFCVRDRRITRAALCEGSFMQFHGEPLLSLDAPLQWLEWTNWEGEHKLAGSDEAAARSFSASALDSEIVI